VRTGAQGHLVHEPAYVSDTNMREWIMVRHWRKMVAAAKLFFLAEGEGAEGGPGKKASHPLYAL
jgi:hypothetical protein